MEKSWIFLVALELVLLFPASNASADIWARGVSQASGWFDAEKDNVTADDDDLCWAASAADVLMWSGWNAGYANEDDVFDFFVTEDPVDAGGWQQYAWKFWFDGSEMGGHFAGSTHTGYYSTTQFTANYYADMSGGSDVLGDINTLLQDGWGVGIAVRGGMDHAVTVWGLQTDASGDFTGIWLTDSDNRKGGPDPRPNTLDYYGLTLSGSRWYLDNFYNTNNVNYIDEIQALRFVPVPGAVLLGMLGLGAAGLRLRKYA